MMVNDRVYCRTPAGDRALKSKGSVPEYFRAILVLVTGLVSSSAICVRMRGHSQKQVLIWLDQLETLGFVDRMMPPPSATPGADISDAQWQKAFFPSAEAGIPGGLKL
jgi:hypothetical protein